RCSFRCRRPLSAAVNDRSHAVGCGRVGSGSGTGRYFVGWAHTSEAWGRMELRHLRYFVAVAEEGSLTVAAERRLHTTQPSLSRQMRDLEYEVGVELLSRSV